MALENISFDDLIKGESVRITDDSPPFLSAVDVIKVVTGKDKRYSAEQLRIVIKDGFFSDEKVVQKKLPGKGNSRSSTVSFQDAIELIFVLPGKTAKTFRRKAAEIITRYYGGDPSLIDEIEANAASKAPINVMARASLGKRLNSDEEQQLSLERVHRNKRMELENQALELEIETKRKTMELEIQAKTRNFEMDFQARSMEIQQQLMERYESLCPDQTMDERMKSRFRDSMANLASQSTSWPAITNGENTLTTSTASTLKSVSELADNIGIRLKTGDVCTLGKKVKDWYRDTHDRNEPQSVLKNVNGHDTQVAAYQQEDWNEIEKMIREFTPSTGKKQKRK